MKNLVIGAAHNLTWDKCRVWAKSLRASGYTGDAVLVYFGDIPLEITQNLFNLNIPIAQFTPLGPTQNVCVTRFIAYHSLLKMAPLKYDWVTATDVTDVVFQTNPDRFIETVDKHYEDGVKYNHIASSENLSYEDEAWGKNNLIHSFGNYQYDMMANNLIYNAGVMSAKQFRMEDICDMIFNLCVGRPQFIVGEGGPDQAAYNVILSKPSLNYNTYYSNHDIGWACQCGTTMDPNRSHYHSIGDSPVPKFDGEFVTTSHGDRYCIVHQYNRVPELREYFERKYLDV